MFQYIFIKAKFTRNQLFNCEEHIKNHNTSWKNGYVQSKKKYSAYKSGFVVKNQPLMESV